MVRQQIAAKSPPFRRYGRRLCRVPLCVYFYFGARLLTLRVQIPSAQGGTTCC